jgi:hypothetical protein
VGRNDEKLSRAMKDAVVAARESGMSPAEIVDHAAAGGFDDLPAFTIAQSTIRRLVAFHRRQQRTATGNGGAEEAGTPEDLPEPDRLRAIAEQTIARVEQLEKPTARDLSAAQQAQRLLDDSARRARRKPPKPAPSTSTLLAHPAFAEMVANWEAEERLTNQVIAELPGEQCQCEPLQHNASKYATAIDPRRWLLHNGDPTCGTCRLPITDWRTRFAGYPVLLKELEAWRKTRPPQSRLSRPRAPQTSEPPDSSARSLLGVTRKRKPGL